MHVTHIKRKVRRQVYLSAFKAGGTVDNINYSPRNTVMYSGVFCFCKSYVKMVFWVTVQPSAFAKLKIVFLLFCELVG